mmetsp:Transcript_70825/g.217077  ORF Transcript_70825/g.217077 Transcript_70825/m.217077 type:complete len:238 (-) Transcript_70825:79-792(-)
MAKDKASERVDVILELRHAHQSNAAEAPLRECAQDEVPILFASHVTLHCVKGHFQCIAFVSQRVLVDHEHQALGRERRLGAHLDERPGRQGHGQARQGGLGQAAAGDEDHLGTDQAAQQVDQCPERAHGVVAPLAIHKDQVQVLGCVGATLLSRRDEAPQRSHHDIDALGDRRGRIGGDEDPFEIQDPRGEVRFPSAAVANQNHGVYEARDFRNGVQAGGVKVRFAVLEFQQWLRSL